MDHDKQPGAGLFAGTDEAICCVFGLKHVRQLRQRTTYREIACHPVPPNVLADLVRQLHRLVSANLGERKPSAENWRWKPQTRIHDENKSPEVVLERAVALLVKQGSLDGWCNQIPVASGLVDHKSDKRAAVDLAKIEGDRLDLYELKWASDTPVHAAFEILRYGLAYLLCRNQKRGDYARHTTMAVSELGLNVLAPLPYYESLDLCWLQAGLDAGIRMILQEQPRPGFRASFRFLALPVEPTKLFASGAEVKTACRATPLIAPEAIALVQAMSNLTPICTAG